MKTKTVSCSCCGRITTATFAQLLDSTAYCPACSARKSYKLNPIIRQNSWVTTYLKKEVREEEAFFPARLAVSIDTGKISSRALLGGRTPEAILIHQEEVQKRDFGKPLGKIDPRWAKLMSL